MTLHSTLKNARNTNKLWADYNGLLTPDQNCARSLQQPLRYLKGTQHYKFVIQPTIRLANNDSTLDLDIVVDADWAGCPTTRRSTTGFVIRFLGATINFNSRTQATRNSSTIISRVRTLRHQHWSHRRTTCQELHLGIRISRQAEHEDSHRQQQRQKHSYKGWSK